jgi:hypothetical protein
MKSVKSTDPALDAIFQSMLNYMGTTYTGMTCNVTNVPTTLTESATLRYANNDTWTYTESSTGPRVSIAPTTATLTPGLTQQFTATVTNADGTPATGATVNWTVSGAGGGTVDATGLYTAPATIAAATTDTVTATLSTGAATASVTVNLNP